MRVWRSGNAAVCKTATSQFDSDCPLQFKNMKTGWYKIIYDPCMPTDFWTPNNEISFVEVKNNGTLSIRKHWNQWKHVVIDYGLASLFENDFLKYVKFVPINIDIDLNPKDEAISKIFWENHNFYEI